ncbi:hypothetical protein OD917_22430 [Flavobacterium sp. SH_e]|nr:hypothetical protein [Flavobacterium sp. SH_e]MCV2487705.1 hypothetical protein [Flavobacterium sp. SH_e]
MLWQTSSSGLKTDCLDKIRKIGSGDFDNPLSAGILNPSRAVSLKYEEI